MKERYVGLAIFIIALLAIPISIYISYNPPKTNLITLLYKPFMQGLIQIPSKLTYLSNLTNELTTIKIPKNISDVSIEISAKNSGILLRYVNNSIMKIYTKSIYSKYSNTTYLSKYSTIEVKKEIIDNKLEISINVNNDGVLILLNPTKIKTLKLALINSMCYLKLRNLSNININLEVLNVFLRGELNYIKSVGNLSIHGINSMMVMEINNIDYNQINYYGSIKFSAVTIYTNNSIWKTYYGQTTIHHVGTGKYRILIELRNGYLELRF